MVCRRRRDLALCALQRGGQQGLNRLRGGPFELREEPSAPREDDNAVQQLSDANRVRREDSTRATQTARAARRARRLSAALNRLLSRTETNSSIVTSMFGLFAKHKLMQI